MTPTNSDRPSLKDKTLAAIRSAARRGGPDVLGCALGVARSAVLEAGIGLVRAETYGDFWAPDDGGRLFVSVPVIDDGVVVDIVIFRIDEPHRWWVRSGYCKALGLDAADEIRDATPIWRLPSDPPPPALLLYTTPLSWLRNGAAGVVILHEKWADYVLGGIDAVIAEDNHHARHLHDALPKRSVPKIRLRKERAAA